MAHVAPIYPNFARGEVSPLMFGRIDIEQYPSCLDKCRNVYIRPYGCASRISGTEFIANTKRSTGKARLLKFVFSATDSYIIECGAGYFRFFRNGGAVIKNNAPAWVTETSYKLGDFVTYDDKTYYCLQTHTSGDFEDDLLDGDWVEQDIYEVPNDYSEKQLDSIQYVQLDDIIKLVCLPDPNHPDPNYRGNKGAKPKELIRNTSDDWTFKDVDFIETPYLDQNTTDITMAPNGTAVGASITVASSKDYFTSDMVGANMWIGTKVTDTTTNKDVQGYVKITGYSNPKSVTAEVKATLSGTTATKLWGEGAFSDYRGYPAVVALFDGRLYYARTPYQPRNVYGSKPYAYETFTPAVDNEDDAGINVELATNANGDGSDIKWMIGASYLLCGTYGGEFIIRSAGDTAITPTDISARQRTNWGGEPIQPIVAGTFIHFLQRNGNKLRQFQYDYYYDAYKAVDVSIFSEHLLESPIKEMALQKNPDSIIYLMREDGKVIMLTLEQDQSVQAWSLLEDMGATVESIQTIPSSEGNYDEVYFLMVRQGFTTALTINSSNPALEIVDNYYETKSEIGVIEETLTCRLDSLNIENVNGATIDEYGVASGFDDDTKPYLKCLDPETSSGYAFMHKDNPWEFVMGIKTPEEASSQEQCLMGLSASSYGISITITAAQHFRMIGYSGSTAIVNATGTYTVQPDTEYLLKMKCVKSANRYIYTLEYSLDDGETWVVDATVNSGSQTNSYPSQYIILGRRSNASNTPYFKGQIYLCKTYISVNNERKWFGVNTYWTDSANQKVSVSNYGIVILNLPNIDDEIYLTYTTSIENPVRYIERIKEPTTSLNRNNWWYLRSALAYDAYSLSEGNKLTLSNSTGNITITAENNIFKASDVGKSLRAVDNLGNVIGEGIITEYTDEKHINLTTSVNFESLEIQGGKWGISITSVSGLNHLERKLVQVFADGLEQNEKRVTEGSIELDKPSFKVVVGLPYQSYITTMPMEAGSQNGTAVGKRKRISEMAIRVWNSLGVRVGRDLNNLYDTIYQQKEAYTGVIPNIKYNQGWVWDANITVEQSRPYPMNILSIAPIVTEVDK